MKPFTNLVVIVLLALITLCVATDIKNCAKTKARHLEPGDVNLSSCPKNKCLLKRNTEPSIEMKIIPKREFKQLNSNIQGIILGVPLPFPGYYGTSACPHIYDAEGKNKVGCPLKAGETYIYKNTIKILPIYPTVSLDVHWALGDEDGDVACFQIPAKIKA